VNRVRKRTEETGDGKGPNDFAPPLTRRAARGLPRLGVHAPSRPEVFRATSAILPIQPGSIASARAPDPGPSRRCLRARAGLRIGLDRAQRRFDRPSCARGLRRDAVRRADVVCRSPIRESERVGLSGAEPRQYCPAVSAILHWSAEDSPTPSSASGPARGSHLLNERPPPWLAASAVSSATDSSCAASTPECRRASSTRSRHSARRQGTPRDG